MWYKALVTLGALICAFGLTNYFGVEPTCGYKACAEVLSRVS